MTTPSPDRVEAMANDMLKSLGLDSTSPSSAPPPPAAAGPALLARLLGPTGQTWKQVTMPADPGLPDCLLPPHIERWLGVAALQAGVPASMTTLPFLAATGAVIGNRLGLQLRPGWVEYPAIWMALVALTGTGKSPALNAMLPLFTQLHDESIAAWQDTGATGDPSPLITSQAGWQQIERILHHTNGLIIHRDELVGLLRAIDGRRGEDRQRYLSLWFGDPIITDDHPTIFNPVVSVIGGIQPLLIHRLRNRQPDGLFDRFLFVLAGGKLTTWNVDAPLDLPPTTPIVDTLRTLRHGQCSLTVSLAPDTARLWASWHDAQTALTREASLVVGGFYRKYPVHLARLAVILHALWHPDLPDQPLSFDTLDRAITLIEFLRIHLHRTLFFVNERHEVHTPADLLERRIADLLSTRHPQWVGHSRLAHDLGRPASAPLNAALQALATRSEMECRTHQPAGGGRPGRQYRWLKHEG